MRSSVYLDHECIGQTKWNERGRKEKEVVENGSERKSASTDREQPGL